MESVSAAKQKNINMAYFLGGNEPLRHWISCGEENMKPD